MPSGGGSNFFFLFPSGGYPVGEVYLVSSSSLGLLELSIILLSSRKFRKELLLKYTFRNYVFSLHHGAK